MKLDIRESKDFAIAAKVKEVKINGVIEKYAIAIDTDTGYMLRYKVNEQGMKYIEPGSIEPATEELYGEIEVNW